MNSESLRKSTVKERRMNDKNLKLLFKSFLILNTITAFTDIETMTLIFLLIHKYISVHTHIQYTHESSLAHLYNHTASLQPINNLIPHTLYHQPEGFNFSERVLSLSKLSIPPLSEGRWKSSLKI